jgi:WhiB family transcriptional regulator, redox-sensing transcriptional regulator
VLRVPPEQPTVTSSRTTLDDLAAYVKQPPWVRDALCLEHPEVDFFPALYESNEPAKAVCAECLVRAECRDAGIEGDEVGIWGGTTGRERQRLRLARRNTAA